MVELAVPKPTSGAAAPTTRALRHTKDVSMNTTPRTTIGPGPGPNRRTFLKGLAAALGVAAVPGGLAACSSGSSGGASPTAGSGTAGGGNLGTVSLGSNYSDEVPREALATALEGFGGQVEVNTVDHNTFQEQINSYLQGRPDQVFAWFAGFRMQFFANQGLATPINGVWEEIGDGYTDAFRQASTAGDDQYFVPFYYYPWGVFYRKSVFDENGWTVPETMDDFEGLCQDMEGTGLTPIAFGDSDGWPAMGTFDYVNLRTNGYDFHVSLMAGEESWESDPVRQTFENWARILPYHQEGALGRTWQDAAQGLVEGSSGMYLLGMFVGQQFPDEEREDLDFFLFPEIESEFERDTIEAPIDGFMYSTNTDNEEGATALLAHLGSAAAQEAYLAADPNNVAANSQADTSNYDNLQSKAAELVGDAAHITQFLDRDTRPDFASTVMIPSLQEFIRNPDGVDSLLTSIEQQKQAIFQQ